MHGTTITWNNNEFLLIYITRHALNVMSCFKSQKMLSKQQQQQQQNKQ